MKLITLTIFAASCVQNASSKSATFRLEQLSAQSLRAHKNENDIDLMERERSTSFNLKDKLPSFESSDPPSTPILTKRGGSSVDNGYPDFIAPSIYLIFAGALVYLIFELAKVDVVHDNNGYRILALVTGALIWDNLIIAVGSIFFRDVAEKPFQRTLLKCLSYPRFTLHAVGTPLQCITLAEMGKAAGIGILQSQLVQTAVIVLSVLVAIWDRLKFARSPGIVLDDHADSPLDALERDLVKFTYKEPLFSYIIPAIILSLFNLVVGIAGLIEGKDKSLSIWMTFAAVTAIVGNGLPGPIMTFSGNLGEITMQLGLIESARIVYGDK